MNISGRQHELHYKHGKMYFEYNGGAKCENGTKEYPNYRFHVILSCDYTVDAQPIHITRYVMLEFKWTWYGFLYFPFSLFVRPKMPAPFM